MRAFALIAFAFLLGPGTAGASLIGDTVNYNYYYPAISQMCCGGQQNQVTAASGTTFASNLGPGDIFSLITDNSIDITFSSAPDSVFFWYNVAFNGPVYSGLQWAGLPSGVQGVTLETNMPGLDSSMITFGADFIAVNFAGLNPGSQGADSGSTFVNLTLDPPADPPAPEPCNVVLSVSGLLGLGLLRSRLSRVPASES